MVDCLFVSKVDACLQLDTNAHTSLILSIIIIVIIYHHHHHHNLNELPFDQGEHPGYNDILEGKYERAIA